MQESQGPYGVMCVCVCVCMCVCSFLILREVSSIRYMGGFLLG